MVKRELIDRFINEYIVYLEIPVSEKIKLAENFVKLVELTDLCSDCSSILDSKNVTGLCRKCYNKQYCYDKQKEKIKEAWKFKRVHKIH